MQAPPGSSLKIDTQTVAPPEGIALKASRNDLIVVDEPTVRVASRKLRNGGKYQFFSSQGTAPIPSPEHITTHKANAGDLFVYKHTEGSQIWFMGVRGWRKTVGNDNHPSDADYVIHTTKGNPKWIMAKSARTYQYRSRSKNPS
jgi:hypothetical protein